MKKMIIGVLLLSLCLGLIACTNTKDVSLGSLDGERYTNDYFGIEITVPEDWTKLNSEQQEQLANLGKKTIAGDDEKLSEQLDLAEEKVLNFITAIKYPLDKVHTINPNVLCNAEKLSFLQGIKNEEQYLEMSKNLLSKAQIPYEFNDDIYNEDLGGQKFTVLKVSIFSGEIKAYQKEVEKIIKSVKFK